MAAKKEKPKKPSKAAAKPAAEPKKPHKAAPPKPSASASPAAAPAAPASPSTYSELSKATVVTPKEGEKREDFLARLIEATNGLADDAFEKLTKTTQKWYKDAEVAYNDSKLPDLKLEGDPFSVPQVVQEVVQEALATQPEPATTPEEQPKAAAVATPQPAATEPKEDNGNRRNNSITQHIRIEVCKNPSLEAEDLCKRLSDRGHKAIDQAYVAGVAHRTRQVLEVKAAVDAGTLT